MTDGMRTSEFMVTVALLCFAVIMVALGEREYAGWALVGAGLGAGGFSISRGIAKSGDR